MLRSLLYGLRRLTHGAEADQELNEEVEQYIAAAAAEYVRRGWGVEAAAAQARIDFGGAAQAKEAVREYGWDGVLFALWRDLVFGARGLRRNPAFTTIALATLALGIGANAAMFSAVNTVVLRPLPYREPKKLALVWTDDVERGLHQEPTAWLLIQDWRSRTKSFESIAAYSAGRAVVTDAATRVSSRRAFVSGNLFATLGASAAVGRVIDQRDEDGAAPVAVVSAGFAMRRDGGPAACSGPRRRRRAHRDAEARRDARRDVHAERARFSRVRDDGGAGARRRRGTGSAGDALAAARCGERRAARGVHERRHSAARARHLTAARES